MTTEVLEKKPMKGKTGSVKLQCSGGTEVTAGDASMKPSPPELLRPLNLQR